MEEDLRKIHLENLLNTLEDSDKDKKIEIEKARTDQDNDAIKLLEKLYKLTKKTKVNYSTQKY